MRTAGLLCLVFAGAVVIPASVAGAQDSRDFVIRLHRAGDTTSIRGAAVSIDHTIEAGNTDSAGIVVVPDLLDGGHIIEAVAHGYQAYFDNFNSGGNIQQPLQLELIPVLVSDTAKAKGQPTDLKFAGLDARRTKAQGKFFTRAQLDAASGRPLANLLKMDAGAVIVTGPHGESRLALRSPAARTALLRGGGARRPADLSVPRRAAARSRQDLRRATRWDRAVRPARGGACRAARRGELRGAGAVDSGRGH